MVYPEKYASLQREGVTVKVINPSTGVEYDLTTNSNGACSADLEYGLYRVSVSDKGTSEAGAIPLFNRSIDAVKLQDTLSGDVSISLDMALSYSSQVVIKEIYFAGCTNPTTNKSYYADGYLSVYNNSDQVAYLDSLCFGCADSYNSLTTQNPWSYLNTDGQRVLRDTIPIIEAVWQWPGTGKSFPLQPGESTVLVFRGAIDHTILNPNSVDLSKSSYFVCYDTRYTNKTYHPSPSPNLAGHWLNLIWKQGTSNAYAFSMVSPTALLFKIQGTSAENFVNNPSNRSRKPGTTSALEYIMVPNSYVLDGVEVMSATTQNKRLPATVDASYVLFTQAANAYQGHSVYRVKDNAATAAAGGRVVLMDTNNSSVDFTISDHQLIKDE